PANTTSNVTDISAMVFDQTGPGTVRLIAAQNPSPLAIANAAARNTQPVTNFLQVNLGNTDALNVMFQTQLQANSISGLSIYGDDITAPDNSLYGTVAAAGSDIVGSNGTGGGGGGNTGGGTPTGAAASEGPGTVIQVHLPTLGNPGYVTGFGLLYTIA